MDEEQIVPVGIATEQSGTELEEVEDDKQFGAAIVPLLGLVVNLNDPSEVAKAMQAVRNAKRQLDEVRADLERVLVDEAARQGTKTLHLDKAEVTVTGGPTTVYDQEELLKLIDAGLPHERYDALVKAKVEYVVDKRVIAQLRGSGNERYVEIIDNAAQEVERPYRVSVK